MEVLGTLRKPLPLVMLATLPQGHQWAHHQGVRFQIQSLPRQLNCTLPVMTPRHHSDGFYRPGASGGSVAKAATDYNKPGDEREVEEIYFAKSPGEPLHGTQFLQVVPNDNFTRMGWEQPDVAFDGLIDREVRQWILPFTNIADFSANREQWHSRWMQAGICRSSVLRNMVLT